MEIIRREFIKPSSPTPADRKQHKLSLLDQTHSAFTYIPLLFFYKNNLNPPKHTCHQHLKQSLSETLTDFYPLAGNLVLPNLVTVDCNDSGALFVEAKVDAPLSEAIRDAPYDHFVRYLPFHPYAAENEPLAEDHSYTRNEVLLAVQVTRFGCGGWAVGICMNHRLGDLSSCLTLLNSWAAISRGEYGLRVRKPGFELAHSLFPPLDFAYAGFAGVEESAEAKITRFVFNREKLIQLKQLAASYLVSSRVKDPTRVEVVTAFLCHHLSALQREANKTNENNPTSLSFGHVVNVRAKVAKSSKDVHSFPFGNLVIPCLFSSTTAAYADLVSIIGNALKEVDQNYVLNSAYPFLKRLVNGTLSILQPPEWYFSSWCRSTMYEVDFGWGKPISAGPGHMLNRRLIILTSTRNQEGIEVWIGLSPEELSLLSQDLLSLAVHDFFPIA